MSAARRVLRVLTRPNVGGPMRQALALWPEDATAGLQTLVAVGQCGAGETEMDCRAIPEIAMADVRPKSRGLVRLQRLGRARGVWRNRQAIAELRALIRAYAPDVVHTHTSQAGYFGRRAAELEGVPVRAHTFHGHVLEDYFAAPINFVLRAVEARRARQTQVLYAISPSCRAELEGFGIGVGRLGVVPPALDLGPFASADRAAARAQMGLTPEVFAVGFVGRLVAIKRPEIFARMMAQLPEMRGLVFGTGPEADVFLGVNNVVQMGAVTGIHECLAGLDALVLSSRREGCPLVAIEAFAAGVPVVGLDVPGVRDALVDWGAGAMVPEADGSAGLAAAVRALATEPARARDLVQRAREGLRRFSARQVAQRFAQDYAAAMAGGEQTT